MTTQISKPATKWTDLFDNPKVVGSSEYQTIHDCVRDAVDSLRWENQGDDGTGTGRPNRVYDLKDNPNLSVDELQHVVSILDTVIETATALRNKALIRSGSALLQKYTVNGRFEDNDQPWSEFVESTSPREAAAEGVRAIIQRNEWEDWHDNDILVFGVTAGHVVDLLGNSESVSGNDLLNPEYQIE